MSLSPPGARSKGSGRAFTALADDASAAENNPGSLARQGASDQYMVEVSAARYLTERAALEDAFATGARSTSGNRTVIPSFVAVAHSINSLTLTAFKSTFLSYSEDFNLQRRRVPDTGVYFLPTDGRVRLAGDTLGVGLGWRLLARPVRKPESPDDQPEDVPRLGVGMSARLQALRFDVDTRRGDVFDRILEPSRLSNVEAIHDEDWSAGLAVGVAWLAAVKHRVQLGASYTYNPNFTVGETLKFADGSPVDGFPRSVRISVPDRASIGASMEPFGGTDPRNPKEEITFAVEAAYERHSELASPGSTLLPNIPGIAPGDFTIRDVTDLHLGLVVPGRFIKLPSLQLLLGARSVQGHSFDYRGSTDTPSGRALALAFDFVPDRRAIGYSCGLRVRRGRLDATAAFEFVNRVSSEASVSLVFRPAAN